MSVNLEEAVLVKGGKIFTGRAGQTKASGITFDPTGTDLVSTTAESAIKEVNAKKAKITRERLTQTTTGTGAIVLDTGYSTKIISVRLVNTAGYAFMRGDSDIVMCYNTSFQAIASQSVTIDLYKYE